MATTNTAVNARQLESAIAKLQTKMARQTQAVKDTEAHIAALEALKTQLEKGK